MKDEKYLHQFRIVAEHLSFTSACLELHITQSALTKNIRKIEDRLGVELFERLPRGVALSPQGRVLLERVRRMELEYHYALEEIAAMNDNKKTKLRIGAGLVWGESVLPGILHEFYEQVPNAEIHIVAGSVDRLLPRMLSGEMDIVLATMEYDDSQYQDILKIPLIQVEHMVVCSEQHPLANAGPVDLKALSSYQWVLYKQAFNDIHHINRLFAKKGLRPTRAVLNTAYLETAIPVLLKDDYLMCLPTQLASKVARYGLKRIDITESIWHFSAGIWINESARQLPAMDRFIDLLTQFVRKHTDDINSSMI